MLFTQFDGHENLVLRRWWNQMLRLTDCNNNNDFLALKLYLILHAITLGIISSFSSGIKIGLNISYCGLLSYLRIRPFLWGTLGCSTFFSSINVLFDSDYVWQLKNRSFLPPVSVLHTVKPVYNGHLWDLKKVAVRQRCLIKLRFRLAIDDSNWSLFTGGR